ncbi:MAG: hypothetical protein LBL04_01975 [Bacteroidales bacterium]|jgi:hypothetical protein|nr:hypothetical protein [Bacteroidales bacterium]
MKKRAYIVLISLSIFLCSYHHNNTSTGGQIPVAPSSKELNRSFGKHDEEAFRLPPRVYRPGTYFLFIGGNVGIRGITADLEAIAEAGISDVLFFHGQFGAPWPGVTPQIPCLSDLWDDAVRHTAEECRRLGLRFTMLNCPGWAMSGGPWIEPSNAMRHLVWSRTDVTGGAAGISLAQPQPGEEPWRDYKDITVLAFPTPLDDSGEPLKPRSVKSNRPELPWMDCLAGDPKGRLSLSPVQEDNPNWIEVTFPEAATVRTVEFSSIRSFNHGWNREPGVTVKVQAILPDGTAREALHVALPKSSHGDDRPISLACSEINDAKTYRISIVNRHSMALGSLRLFSAARKNNWESEAGWTLRSMIRQNENPEQSQAAFIDPAQIRDVTTMMDGQGSLKWDVPAGAWTILRIGHVNTGMRNGPAPPEGTGWECDKLSEAGTDAQFAGYIGRLSGGNGPLAGGLLNGMHLDSWECGTQTWTDEMETEFRRIAGYSLRSRMPAIFGYVVGDHETSARFLRDWRAAISDLFTNKFYGRMAKLAEDNGLAVSYETAAGDAFPADILEYYKYADIPMCEFWQPFTDEKIQRSHTGNLNYKPIKPTASAARIYGKPRIAAEAFTSFNLTWDEHWDMLKEAANINFVEGVTHLVLHTYTHNPRTDFLPPGASFGSNIGTPFLRGQTWWKHMPEFTAYFSRCTYLLERGKPVSDVLWYLGDEIDHIPDQEAPFPAGFKYDYCNPDVLLNRLTVRNGMLTTPEGISYRVLWLPDSPRMLPQTLEKLYALVRDGATVIGDAPRGLATLSDAAAAQQRFETFVENIWGKTPERGVRKLGKGAVISGMTLDEALNELKIRPDVTGGDALWLHRRIDGADWYYVCAPKGKGFVGTLDFHSNGSVEIWDPLTGTITAAEACRSGDRTSVTLDLPQSGSCFVVFRKKGKSPKAVKSAENKNVSRTISLAAPWTLAFPDGWGAPSSLRVAELKAWKDLDIPDEAKAFSGTATYSTTFDAGEIKPGMYFSLDLGRVEMIAVVSLNGKPLRTLWTPPCRVDLTEGVRPGSNVLTVEVTSSWFNRLVYDAGQPEEERKTWTVSGPAKDQPLRESGLLGPVVLTMRENM